VAERHVAIGTAALIPLLILVTVFKQWPSVRAELRHEASLGVIFDEDVRSTAHPLLRLGRAGWHDAGAHREFVRIANKIALRKRQQRGRPEEVARLYQLEVIKLRMELQEMTRIDRAMRAQAERLTERGDSRA
jgi:cbb3-type cytochrome oxidase subunit 3